MTAFSAMWRLLAVSFPFCIGGTRAAAAAHSTVIAVTGTHMPAKLGLTHTNAKHKTSLTMHTIRFRDKLGMVKCDY